MNWNQIKGKCKNGIITGHVLQIHQLHGNGTMNYIRTDQVNSTTTDHILKNVSHGINYIFTVACINGPGFGDNSWWDVRTLGKISKY